LPRESPRTQRSWLPRIVRTGVSPDAVSEDPGPVRRGLCSQERCAGEPRPRGQWLLSTQIFRKYDREPLLVANLVGDRYFSADRSRSIAGNISTLNASPQYEGLPILATANRRRKQRVLFPCAFTEFSNSAPLLAISLSRLLILSASWQEKASGCHRNGAASHAHIPNADSVAGRRAPLHLWLGCLDDSLSTRDLTHHLLERIFQVDRIGANCFKPVLLDAVLAQAARRQD
jgi:hypothetical protein